MSIIVPARLAFVARQPIVDRARQTFAYELLFRPSGEADGSGGSSDAASAQVMANAVLALGLDTLAADRLAFVNVTRRLLLEGLPAALPPGRVVIEILEDIDADDEVMTACRELRRAGYAIALDDFAPNERNEALIPLADYIKVDYLVAPGAAQDVRARLSSRAHPRFIAEKIETAQQFDAARDDGCHYFQGYFLGRPVIEQARQIPENRLAILRLLGAMADPDLSVTELENLVKHDATICYRVLLTVNSAGFAVRSQVKTVREALIMLGRDTVRRWAAVMALAVLGNGSPPALVEIATVRARFCELVMSQSRSHDRGMNGFLAGMCSLIDVLLGCPMADALVRLPLDEETRSALLGQDNLLRRALDTVIAYEHGAWDGSLAAASSAGLDGGALPELYAQSLHWARDVRHATNK